MTIYVIILCFLFIILHFTIGGKISSQFEGIRKDSFGVIINYPVLVYYLV